MSTFDAGAIEATLTLDRTPWLQGMRAARAQGDAFGKKRWTATLDADTRQALAKIEALQKKVDALNKKASIRFATNTAGVNRSLTALEKRLERISDLDVEPRFDIDVADDIAAVEALRDELVALDREHVEPSIDTDVAAALAETEALRAELRRLDHATATPRVSTTGFTGARLGMQLLVAGAAALSPILVPALAGGAAAALGLGAALATAAGGLGVLFLGFSGVGAAVKALSQAQNTATTSTRGLASAQTGLASAQSTLIGATQALARARRGAAEQAVSAALRVQDAERALASAQRDATLAQQDLNDARAEARRRLEDLTLSLEANALAQRRATLDVQDARDALNNLGPSADEVRRAVDELSAAQERYNMLLADPTVTETARRAAEVEVRAARDKLAALQAAEGGTARERATAQLALDEALQRQKELSHQGKRLAADKKRSDRQGVEGSDEVAAAQARIRQANERVADAERDLAEARRQQAVQARESAYAVAQAQRSVADAQRGVAEAQRRVAESATGAAAGVNSVQTAMGRLTPEGRRFALFLFGLRGYVQQLQATAQRGLLPGVQAGLTAMLPLFPLLNGFVDVTASTFGDLFEAAGGALTAPFWVRFFRFINRTAGPNTILFAGILGNLAAAAAGLIMAFEPFGHDLLRWLSDATGSFAAWSQTLGQSEGFRSFMGFVRSNGPLVVDMLVSLARAIIQVGVALAPNAAPILGFLTGLFNSIADADPATIRAVATALIALFAALTTARAVAALAALPGIGAALSLVAPAAPWVLLAAAVAGLGLAAIAASGQWDTFVDHLGDGTKTVRDAFRGTWRYITDFWRGLTSTTRAVTDELGRTRIEPFVPRTRGEKAGAAFRNNWLDGIKALIGDFADGLRKYGGQLVDDFNTWVRDTDWSKVGLTFGSELGAALAFGDDAVADVQGAIIELLMNVDWVAVGLALAAAAGGAVIGLFKQGLIGDFIQIGEAIVDGLGDGIAGSIARFLIGAANLPFALVTLIKGILGVQSPSTVFYGIGVDVVQGLLNGLLSMGASLLSTAATVAGNLLSGFMPSLGSLRNWFDTLLPDAARSFARGVGNAMTNAGRSVQTGWHGTIRPALGSARDWLRNLIPDAARTAANWITDQMNRAGRNTRGAYDGHLRPVFRSTRDWLRDLGVDFFQFADDTARAWRRVRDAAKNPVEFLIDTIINKGILGSFREVAGYFDVNTKKYRNVPSPFAAGGTVYPTNMGVIPGWTPGRDTGYIAVGGGESVMRPEWTAAAGSTYVQRANAAARTGGVAGAARFIARNGLPGFAGAYALGGIVAKRRKLVEFGRMLQRQGWRVGEHPLFGGVAPVHSPGSWHYRAGALDVNWLPGQSRAEMAKIDQLVASRIARQQYGLRTIYRYPRHYNHVHFDLGAGPDLGSFSGKTSGGGGDLAALLDPFSAVKDKIGKAGAGLSGDVVKAAGRQLVREIEDWITDHNPFAIFGEGSVVGGGGAVRDIVRRTAKQFGWDSGAQWRALATLIQHESSWNPRAQNPTSSASGLFQFLSSTWATVGGHKTWDPALQALYGLRYIRQRYGTPVKAWTFWQRNHWYDDGGLAQGAGFLAKKTLKPERMLDPRTTTAFERLIDLLESPQWDPVAALHGTVGGDTVYINQYAAPGLTSADDLDRVLRKWESRKRVGRRS